MTVVSENLALSTSTSSRSGKLKAIYSPLWLCFLLAILLRVWIIVHTHGVMAGGENEGGVQTENIFLGGDPVHYFCQPLIGILGDFFAAVIFLFFRPPGSAVCLAADSLNLI